MGRIARAATRGVSGQRPTNIAIRDALAKPRLLARAAQLCLNRPGITCHEGTRGKITNVEQPQCRWNDQVFAGANRVNVDGKTYECTFGSPVRHMNAVTRFLAGNNPFGLKITAVTTSVRCCRCCFISCSDRRMATPSGLGILAVTGTLPGLVGIVIGIIDLLLSLRH